MANNRTGRRVNLADLANDAIYTPPVTKGITTQVSPQSSTARVRDIVANPLNKRSSYELDEDMLLLVDTIKEHGVLQPIIVCASTQFLKKYPDQSPHVQNAQWVALMGNRRLYAAHVAELDTVPIVVNDDHIASMYEVMLVENGH